MDTGTHTGTGTDTDTDTDTHRHTHRVSSEVVFYCHTAYPFDMSFTGAEYIDFNKSLARLVGPDGDTDPWCRTMPTLVGSGQFAYRRLCTT